MTKQTIGFIGLGDMGGPMAARLLEHGYRVLSCVHRRREAMEKLKSKGIVESVTPGKSLQKAAYSCRSSWIRTRPSTS